MHFIFINASLPISRKIKWPQIQEGLQNTNHNARIQSKPHAISYLGVTKYDIKQQIKILKNTIKSMPLYLLFSSATLNIKLKNL